MLTGILRAILFYVSLKGGSIESLERDFSDPKRMRFRLVPSLTEDELIQNSQEEDRKFCNALIALAGDRTKKISREEFRRKYRV